MKPLDHLLLPDHCPRRGPGNFGRCCRPFWAEWAYKVQMLPDLVDGNPWEDA